MSAKIAMIVAALFVFYGCDREKEPLPRNHLVLATVTHDVATGLGGNPSFMFVVTFDRPGLVAPLAASVSREAYFSSLDTGVEFKALVDMREVVRGSAQDNGTFVVRSKAQLPIGWYALHLGSIASRAQYSRMDFMSFAGDDIGIRFHVGRLPIVSQVRFCSGEGYSPRMKIMFSEGLSLIGEKRMEDAVALRTSSGAIISCDSLSATDAPLLAWDFACPSLPETSKLILTLSGLGNADGELLAFDPHFSPTSSISSLSSLPMEGDCRYLRAIR